MKEEIFILGVRINKDIRDFLGPCRNRGKMSTVVRNIIYEYMESRDPVKILDQLVDRLERGEIHPKRFIAQFNEIKLRYRKAAALYDMANEKIDELERNGVIKQALGKLRLQEIDNWIDK